MSRWISADPNGFSDGPNLYAYVHNAPLTHKDLYGLLDKDDDRQSHTQEKDSGKEKESLDGSSLGVLREDQMSSRSSMPLSSVLLEATVLTLETGTLMTAGTLVVGSLALYFAVDSRNKNVE